MGQSDIINNRTFRSNKFKAVIKFARWFRFRFRFCVCLGLPLFVFA